MNTASTTLTPAAFTGWHRPHHRAAWKAVVRANAEAECFALLLQAVAGGDKLVTPSGTNPNATGRTLFHAGGRRRL